MHAVLVHNPTAGSGSHRAEALTSILKEAGYSVTACSTKECVYKEALKEQADLVLIAGGDGAVGRVVRCLPHYNTPVAILPLGTANNIARTLGIEGDAERLIECVRRHVTRSLDVGIASGPWGRRRFVEGRMIEIDGCDVDCGVLIPINRIQMISDIDNQYLYN